MRKYGFIGAGNMGLPLIKGAVKLAGAENVAFYEPFAERAAMIEAETGAKAASGNVEMVCDSEVVVFCVKPQIIGNVLKELAAAKEVWTEGRVFMSIAAGVSCADIRAGLGHPVRIARVMPNTPAMVGEGMACLCFDESDAAFTDEMKAAVVSMLESVGKVEIIPEKLMSAATCANGSSPAYVYMFIEALADSVVKYGIPRSTAYTLAAQTVLGSAKMVLESGEHPGALKDKVCSPGGTTIAAVEALEEYGFRNAVMKATDACFAKSEELAKAKK